MWFVAVDAFGFFLIVYILTVVSSVSCLAAMAAGCFVFAVDSRVAETAALRASEGTRVVFFHPTGAKTYSHFWRKDGSQE